MKKSIFLWVLVLMSLSFSACFKEIDSTFDETTLVEFEESVRRAPATGRTFAILTSTTPSPATFPAATTPSGLVLNRTNVGVFSTQVNLVGAQRSADETITFRVVPEFTTAVEGVHYTLVNNGTFTIPAGSSFGQCQVNILAGMPQITGTSVDLVLELVGNSNIGASVRHARIGYRISLN